MHFYINRNVLMSRLFDFNNNNIILANMDNTYRLKNSHRITGSTNTHKKRNRNLTSRMIRFTRYLNKDKVKSNQIYSQVMTVCVQRTGFSQGGRNLACTLQRISSNENKSDFQIYFWPRGIHYSTSHVNRRIKISVLWKWPLFVNQMTWTL